MGALTGLQVVELTSGLVGSVTGMHLSDHGAEVVKVEPSGGDRLRDRRGFPLWNRGKRSVVLDPVIERSGEELTHLLLGADVCLVNDHRCLDAFRIDRAQLLRRHPRLVLAELPPYAGDTPWAGNRESAGLLTADLGMSLRQFSTDDSPVDYVTPAVLYLHAAWASACVTAALVERESSGFGQVVTVTGPDAVKLMAAASIAMSEDAPSPHANFGPAGRHPTYTRYRCADGRWVATGALGPWMEREFLHLLELGDVLADPRIGGVSGRVTELGNTGWVTARIAERMLTRDSQHWVALLTGARIPVGVLNAPWSWLDDAQMRAIGMRVELADSDVGPLTMPGCPVTLYGTPADRRSARRPPASTVSMISGVRPRKRRTAGRSCDQDRSPGARSCRSAPSSRCRTRADCSDISAQRWSAWNRRAAIRGGTRASLSPAAH